MPEKTKAYLEHGKAKIPPLKVIRDLYQAGVVDPTKVVRSALQNSISVSTLLLSSDALITDAPEKEGGDDHDHDHDHEDY